MTIKTFCFDDLLTSFSIDSNHRICLNWSKESAERLDFHIHQSSTNPQDAVYYSHIISEWQIMLWLQILSRSHSRKGGGGKLEMLATIVKQEANKEPLNPL